MGGERISRLSKRAGARDLRTLARNLLISDDVARFKTLVLAGSTRFILLSETAAVFFGWVLLGVLDHLERMIVKMPRPSSVARCLPDTEFTLKYFVRSR
jgi:hypothetical protein